jgi:hypothetical protein
MMDRRILIEDVKGRDLPKDWAERAGIGPDEVVRVTIGPNRRELAAALRGTMDRISARIEAVGLDPNALLKDVADFPVELLRD